MFSEVIGLGLRYRLPCPVEVTLVPETIRRQQALRRKKPYVFAALASLLVILFVAWFGVLNRAGVYARSLEQVEQQRRGVETYATKIKGYNSETQQRQNQISSITDLLKQRQRWPDIYNELYRLKPDGLWLHSVHPIIGEIKPVAASSTQTLGADGMGMGMGGPGMEFPGSMPGAMPGSPDMGGAMPMPGGDMAMGGPGGEQQAVAGPSYEAKPITGLVIAGHGVIMGTSNASQAIKAAADGLRDKEAAAGRPGHRRAGCRRRAGAAADRPPPLPKSLRPRRRGY